MTLTTFEELKGKYESKLSKDTEVNCKILAKLKEGYVVDINEEWEGFIPITHVTESESSDNSFKAIVLSGPDKTDRYMVSPKVLKEKGTWELLERLKSEDTPLRVKIAKVVKGGVEIYIDSLRGFLPGRYIRLPGVSQENWVDQEIEVIIEEIDPKEKKLIFNQKKAVDLEKQRKAEDTIQKLKEGDIVTASVLRIADFGVFVDLCGIDGLIPASELSWGRYSHPKDIVKIGQKLKARIFRVEKENHRIALSVKQILGDPWDQVKDLLKTGSIVKGTVISEANFGVFVELKPGVEALLHNSEIPSNIEKPKVGSEIISKLIKIELDQRKAGLSLTDVEQNQEAIDLRLLDDTSSSNSDEDLPLEMPSVTLDNLTLCSYEGETEALNN